MEVILHDSAKALFPCIRAVTCKRAGFFSAVNFSCVCERCYYYYSIQVFEKVMSVSLLRSRSTTEITRTTNFVSAKENM